MPAVLTGQWVTRRGTALFNLSDLDITMQSNSHHDARRCYALEMRTTITLDDDVAAAIRELRRERSMGLSEAVNELIRGGLNAPRRGRKPFKQRTYTMGLLIDVTDIAEALE